MPKLVGTLAPSCCCTVSLMVSSWGEEHDKVTSRQAPCPAAPGTRQRPQTRLCFGRGRGQPLAPHCRSSCRAPRGSGGTGPVCFSTVAWGGRAGPGVLPGHPPSHARTSPQRQPESRLQPVRSRSYPQRVDAGFEGPQAGRLLQQPCRRAPCCRRQGMRNADAPWGSPSTHKAVLV